MCDIGKILYYAFIGEFVVPSKYYFVAPGGINRELQKLIYSPMRFKRVFIETWDKYCAEKIYKGKKIPLVDHLLKIINGFDFATVETY
ncbi:MAG TPA: hypothetical protein VNK03_05570 [Gammaproteobacteria bacterium]|nr:hypothetical protein [Gammaproteobacteria bacterium]